MHLGLLGLEANANAFVAQCPNKVGGRRDHKRRTQYYCPECDVALHPECSDLYHQTRGIANLVEVVQEENEY